MFQHSEDAKIVTLDSGVLTYEMPENLLWIGVDFDGTLATFDHWHGVEHTGEPLMPMVQKVRELLVRGTTVKIFTARVNDSLKLIADTYALPYEMGADIPEDNRWTKEDKQKSRELKQKIQLDRIARHTLEMWCLKHIGCKLPLTNSKDVWCRGIYDDIAIQMVPNTGQTLAVQEQAEYLAERGAKPNET